MEQYADRPGYVTLKDRIEKFKTKLACRLTNPAQIRIVIVSKAELEKINRAITNQIKYNK